MNFINVYNKMDRRITKCDRSGVNMNKKENIMKKKLTAILLAAAMAVTGLFTAMTPEKANAAEWEACDIPVIKDVSEFDAVSAMYSKTITVTKKDKNIEQGYGSFQLKSDSWVILKTTSSLVTSQEDGHQTHIEVFSDASASNKVLETGDGYWEYDGDQYTILKKGTYYFHTKSSCQNYDTFTGNINVVAAAIPTSKLIQTGVKKNSKDRKSTRLNSSHSSVSRMPSSA